MKKMRLDKILVNRGLFPTREKARRAVMAGMVRVGGKLESKPGKGIDPRSGLDVIPARLFVSRGGEKLAGALRAFGVSPRGGRCLDIGASTGGFTDCLLQAGAKEVVAVDVGYGQIAARLRQDPRVTVIERRNARYLSVDDLPFRPDLVTIDVSFISLKKIIPAVAGLMERGGRLIALVKPQFEAGRKEVGKGGVVRDPRVHARVLWEVASSFEEKGFTVLGIIESPLRGPAGNKEFFLNLVKQ